MSTINNNSSPNWAVLQAEATAREASNLIRAEDADIMAGFVDPAVKTLEWLPSRAVAFCFRMDTSSAMCGTVQMSMWKDVPDDIGKGWAEWRGTYAALQARNPRLELADEIGWIGEVIDASYWPYGQEDGYAISARICMFRRAGLPGSLGEQGRGRTLRSTDCGRHGLPGLNIGRYE